MQTRFAILAMAICLTMASGWAFATTDGHAQAPSIWMQPGEFSATGGLWIGDLAYLNVDATAPNGIRRMQVFVDGAPHIDSTFPCDYGYPGVIPCHPRGLSEVFPTARYADGVHAIQVVAFEAYG